MSNFLPVQFMKTNLNLLALGIHLSLARAGLFWGNWDAAERRRGSVFSQRQNCEICVNRWRRGSESTISSTKVDELLVFSAVNAYRR